ncbi:MAG TPA: PilN domain-containing protein [Candidatus Limnocylindria bacterium]|nr:PilN domain-containing protein [Candidatus Limnocylindria bacterium]
MTLTDLTQRLGRADLLDGIGVYVAPDRVALAHLRKRLWRVQLLDVAVQPLPPVGDVEGRRRALVEAVSAFAGARRGAGQRACIVLPRRAAMMTRVVLPAAAAENLGEVLAYEIENLVPLPKDEVHYEWVPREQRNDRVEVLLASLPRAEVEAHTTLLEEAGLRVRSLGIASAALADYVLFCRGKDVGSLGLLVPEGPDLELALVHGQRLCSSQVVPMDRLTAGTLEQAVVRQLAEEQLQPSDVTMIGYGLPEAVADYAQWRDADLTALAAGRLEDEGGRLAGMDPAVLPAIGGALAAIREQVVPFNLLPADQRRAAEEGPSIATVGLASLAAVLLVVLGFSVLVKERLMLRDVKAQLAALEPQVREVRQLQDEIDRLQEQLKILGTGEDVRATRVLRDLTELVPKEAYLTTLTLRQGKVTMDGQATLASELIATLEKSRRFRQVQFSSPTTRAGDKERFALSAEVAR